MAGAWEIGRRSLLGAPLAFALLAAERAARAQTSVRRLPVLPFNTSFSYWDHHWIQWLPDHPVYEAIEVAIASPAPAETLVRLWLTERALGKRQVYYFNDTQVARSFGQESHFAPIDLRFSGSEGAARDLDLGFTDKDGAPVRWRMTFPASTPLSRVGTGLKPQNGHAARSVLLFWYINPGAVTTDARLSIGGDDYAVHSERPAEHGYHAAYDSGAYSAVVAFGPSEVALTQQGFASSFAGGRAFRAVPYETPGEGIYACDLVAFRGSGRIDLGYADRDAVTSYRHSQGDHAFSIRFDRPLAAYGSSGETGFNFFLDDHRVASGIVRPALLASLTTELHWEFADPPWAREAGLRTAITPHPDGGYAMLVSAAS